MKRLSLSLLLFLGCALLVVGAQNTPRSLPEYWFDDDEWHLDVQYIITGEELSTYHQLKTVEQRNNFIAQFWVRRDPTPGTPQNEFREEYGRRVEYAKAHFADPGDPGRTGLETDRGRVYAMFGPPDRIDRHSTAFFEIWHYGAAPDLPSDFRIQFSVPPMDSCDGSYRITSPAPVAFFEGVSDGASPKAQVMHPSVEVYPRRFITTWIPLDFSKTAIVIWTLLNNSGDPVVENEEPIIAGSFGPAKGNEQLSKHLLGCRLFGPGGMAFTHPVPPGSYSFASEVTLTNGDVQREIVRFDVK